jgi:hypothetical protein
VSNIPEVMTQKVNGKVEQERLFELQRIVNLKGLSFKMMNSLLDLLVIHNEKMLVLSLTRMFFTPLTISTVNPPHTIESSTFPTPLLQTSNTLILRCT